MSQACCVGSAQGLEFASATTSGGFKGEQDRRRDDRRLSDRDPLGVDDVFEFFLIFLHPGRVERHVEAVGWRAATDRDDHYVYAIAL